MLTLPDTLTPQQLRQIDEAGWNHLRPESPAIWHDFLGTMEPCVWAGNYWSPITHYDSPGPGNTEVAERMGKDINTDHVFYYYEHETSLFHVVYDRRGPVDRVGAPRGAGPDLPRAILATFCDLNKIGIPEAET